MLRVPTLRHRRGTRGTLRRPGTTDDTEHAEEGNKSDQATCDLNHDELPVQAQAKHADARDHAEKATNEIPHRLPVMSGENRNPGAVSGGLMCHGA